MYTGINKYEDMKQNNGKKIKDQKWGCRDSTCIYIYMYMYCARKFYKDVTL